jgi:hypothetical protein
MPSIYEVFNIPKDYNLDQLKKSYINIIENLSKSDRNQIEKGLLAEQYKRFYKLGKKEYFDRMYQEDTDVEYYQNNNLFDRFDRLGFGELSIFDPFGRNFQDPFVRINSVFNEMNKNMYNTDYNNSKVYSYSSSYRSTSNNDGSTTIIELKSENKNGEKNKTINAFKKSSDGKIIPLSEDEMKQIENS